MLAPRRSFLTIQKFIMMSQKDGCQHGTKTKILNISYTNSEIIQRHLKKDFCHEFCFFNGFTQTPYPNSLKQPKSTKRDESFLLMLSY